MLFKFSITIIKDFFDLILYVSSIGCLAGLSANEKETILASFSFIPLALYIALGGGSE